MSFGWAWSRGSCWRDRAFPADPSEWADTDGDGVGDNADLDDDGDGQSDADEVSCGSDPLDAESVSPDADADGVPDCVDPDVVTTTTGSLPTTTTPVTTTEPPVAVLPATGRAVDGALWRTTLALGAGVTLVAVSRRAGGSVSS